MRLPVASLLVWLLLAGGASGADLPMRQKALVLLRVLAYDRGLKARAGAEVRVAVVFRPGNARSEEERDYLVAELQEVAQRAVAAGLPISVVALPLVEGAQLAQRLRELGVAALFACDGLEGEAATLARVAREGKVLAFSASRRMVEEGFAVAIVDRGDRAGLVVSPRAAAAQGADLDSALLALAELVDGARREPSP